MFVLRNEEGKIIGLFANAQPNWAEEYLAEDDPEVLAFHEALVRSAKA